MTRGEAKYLRRVIEQAAQGLDDAVAVTAATLYPAWSAGSYYEAETRVKHGGVLYRVLTGHTAQESWTPDTAPSLFARVLIPDPEVIPAWEQPESTNPYMAGDKVTHNGKTWVSDMDNNTWEPGVYGWTEYEEEQDGSKGT